MTRAGKPVGFQICGANHYVNKFPQWGQPEPPETEKYSANATIGNTDWNDGSTEYSGLKFYQTSNHTT